MISLAVVLVVAALFCLAFDTTRLFGVALGVAGIALMFFLHPLLFPALSILGGVGFYFYRRVFHAIPKYVLPKLFDRRD